MELRQESLFADETKGGIEVIYSKFIDQRRMDYKALFGGFDHLRVITYTKIELTVSLMEAEPERYATD